MTSKSFDSTEIFAFLQEHPEFFAEHSALFSTLKLPNARGNNVISFTERQIEHLQQENQQLKQQLHTLIHNAQRSESIRQRMHDWACQLIQHPDWGQAPETMAAALADCFQLDYARILLPNELEQPITDTYTGPRQQAPVDFELPSALHSMAYAPLMTAGQPEPLGLLLLGAKDETHFAAGMATDFLQHIAGLCAASLARA